jgi:hypothetical protein
VNFWVFISPSDALIFEVVNFHFFFLTTDAKVFHYPPFAYQRVQRGCRLSQIFNSPSPSYSSEGYEGKKEALLLQSSLQLSSSPPPINEEDAALPVAHTVEPGHISPPA